jgi:Deoxycytidylate deaminase
MAENPKRPEYPEYFMNIAMAVRERANCLGSRVGAVLILGRRVIATGYNGTPSGMTNCDEGGCERCANRGKKYESGTYYDICICVHAEQNALLSAARFGTPVEGADLFTTTRPCFGFAKELLQAQVNAVYYLHEWSHPDERFAEEYERLQERFPGGVIKVEMDDPREDWARGRRGPAERGASS